MKPHNQQGSIKVDSQKLQFYVRELFSPLEVTSVIASLVSSLKVTIEDENKKQEENNKAFIKTSMGILAKLLFAMPEDMRTDLLKHIKEQGFDIGIEKVEGMAGPGDTIQ